jgi:hypothetical protein
VSNTGLQYNKHNSYWYGVGVVQTRYCNIISTGPYNNPSAVYPDIALHISNYYISSLSDSVLVQKSSVHVHVEVWI